MSVNSYTPISPRGYNLRKTQWKPSTLERKGKDMENDSQITACDAEVLRYFRKHGPAPTADAKKALPDIGSAEHRIAALAKPDTGLLAEDADTSYEPMRPLHIGLGVYRITPKGEIALDDYLSEKRRTSRRERLTNLWAPITVGLLAYLVGYALDHLLG